ncbi:prolyl 3-hydroxylase 2-like isoform X2 [Rhipicephalus sanguineus]|uniref:prolyl 3-hydroxylase 2-like isoform X2 n=1 Tax=Rhipicephalus sanguineus TaxID=34632 RepID=UPI0020C317E2|nr:prolyl 3-hydroxylase 2-like isoform X2 [Rhipicephalus sanguineus]
MRYVTAVLLCLAAAAAVEVRAEFASGGGVADYESLYHSAVESYLSAQWAQCVASAKDALEAYRKHVDVVVTCRIKCSDRLGTGVQCATVNAFYVARAAQARCLRNCTGVGHDGASDATLRDFRDRVPYYYLQRCYFENLFRSAATLYTKKKYAESLAVMEEAISSYLKAEEECRALCDDFLPTAFTTREFAEVAAGHHLASLKCKEQCPDQLSYLDGHRRPNFFASFYHYLQFSYYQLGKLQKACEATQSYLLLVPDDSEMWYNQAFYAQLPSTQDAWFKARQEVEEYVRHRGEEQETIKAIELQLGTVVAAPQVKESDTKDASFNTSSITVVQDEKALNGTRVVAEGFLTEDECAALLSLADIAALTGDGYDGKQSPHSKFETFEGITAGRIALLTRNGQIDKQRAELFLEASERVRRYVKSYFNLDSHLYFSYTHLVCRKAMSGASRRPESDMSHSIHADNCILQKSGNCLKQLPAYIWRDFSSVLYLNDDFVGGEFVFARQKNSIEALVKPKCGRAVAFSAGAENLHGVLPVAEGRRCALATWYTFDPKYREGEREFAHNIINQRHSSGRQEKLPSELPKEEHLMLAPPRSLSVQGTANRHINEL